MLLKERKFNLKSLLALILFLIGYAYLKSNIFNSNRPSKFPEYDIYIGMALLSLLSLVWIIGGIITYKRNAIFIKRSTFRGEVIREENTRKWAIFMIVFGVLFFIISMTLVYLFS